MPAGRMDQPITLQTRVRVADLAGGFNETWADLATVWAKVRPKSAREALDEGRMNAAAVNVFTIYTRGDFSEADRIVWNGETWNVRAVLRAGEQPLTMQVEAERGVAP